MIPGVVLAAGASTRLGGGRAKQLLALDEKGGSVTLLRHAVETAVRAAGAGVPVVVVLGHRAAECAAELAGMSEVRTVRAESWAAGMGASLKAGLRAVLGETPDAAGVVVSLCDQPLVTAAHLGALGQAIREGGPATVAAADYAGGPGVPAALGRDVFGQVWELGDAGGAKSLLLRAQAAGRLRRVFLPEAATDVDTAEDWTRLRRGPSLPAAGTGGSGPLPPAVR